jgi:hypothetical protein
LPEQGKDMIPDLKNRLLSETTTIVSDPFIYKIDPANYLLFAEVVKTDPTFFSSWRKIIKSTDRAIISGEMRRIFSQIAEYVSEQGGTTLADKLEIISKNCQKFSQECAYFQQLFKELGAALKFNPLATNKSGEMVRERLVPLLKDYTEAIQPRGVFCRIEISREGHDLLLESHDVRFTSSRLSDAFFPENTSSLEGKTPLLNNTRKNSLTARDMIMYVVTIGPGIDDAVKKLTESGEIFDAYVLNGIGGAAAEMVAYDLNLFCNDQLLADPQYEYHRFSPGYGDWPLTDQSKIFRILKPEDKIEVYLKPGGIMLPEKSTSGITGLRKLK